MASNLVWDRMIACRQQSETMQLKQFKPNGDAAARFLFCFLHPFDSAIPSPEYPIRDRSGPCIRVSTYDDGGGDIASRASIRRPSIQGQNRSKNNQQNIKWSEGCIKRNSAGLPSSISLGRDMALNGSIIGIKALYDYRPSLYGNYQILPKTRSQRRH